MHPQTVHFELGELGLLNPSSKRREMVNNLPLDQEGATISISVAQIHYLLDTVSIFVA